MSYFKPVNKKTLKEVVYEDHTAIGYPVRVENSIDLFEEAAWRFTEKQYVNVIANIIAERAVRLGGGKFIDAIIKELQARRPHVTDAMYD